MNRIRSYLVLILLMLCMGVYAQNAKINVASFERDLFDTSARDGKDKKVDGNGSLYAIIKVTTDLPDDKLGEYTFSFGNMKHESKVQDGKILVHVQKNARRMIVTRNGYQRLEHDFDSNIEAGANYTMVLSVAGASVQKQMLEFVVKPLGVGAVVMIKGNGENAAEELFGMADATGVVAKSMPLGTYTYRIFDNQNIYKVSEGIITLSDRSVTKKEPVTLVPDFSTITLKAEEGVEIYVDGELKGTGAWQGPLKAGNHQVECKKANCKPSTQYIGVQENNDQTITLNPLTPLMGTLAVTSNPSGANITIDGKDYGQTPRNIDIAIGHHSVTLSKADYPSTTLEVDVKENETKDVDGKLGDNAAPAKTNKEKAKADKPEKESKKQSQPAAGVTSPILRKTQFYVQPTFQVGSTMAMGAELGAYVQNINIEAGYLMGLSKSEEIWWNYTGDDADKESASETLKPSTLSLKLGYGIGLGSRMRITPQAGLAITNISGDKSKSNVSSLSLGVRAEYAFAKHIGVTLTPQYNVAVSKSDTYQMLEPFSSRLKGWGSGFNLQAGVNIFF